MTCSVKAHFVLVNAIPGLEGDACEHQEFYPGLGILIFRFTPCIYKSEHSRHPSPGIHGLQVNESDVSTIEDPVEIT